MGLIILICAAIVIARVADAEDRSSPIWALATVACGYGLAAIGLGLWVGSGVAMIGLFGLMFVLNVIQGWRAHGTLLGSTGVSSPAQTQLVACWPNSRLTASSESKLAR